MASISIEEPRVKVSEIIRDFPVQLNITGETNIGGVIVAPTGPRLAFISGPQDFLDNYTVDGNVPRNADITFLNAYYLSYSAGLVIARSMNTTAVGGMYFTSTTLTETKLLINFASDSIWGLQICDKYYWSNDGDSNWDNFISTIRTLIKDDGVTHVLTAEQITAIQNVARNGDELTNQVYCKDKSDLADKLAANLTTYLSTKINCIWDENVGGIIISPSVSDLGLEADTCVNTIVAQVNNESPSKALVGTPIKYKDGVPLVESEVLQLVFDDGINGNWGFTYGTMAYYHGAIDKSIYEDYSLVSCDSIDDIINSINGINGMAAEEVAGDGENTYKIQVSFSEGNRLYIGEDSLENNCKIAQEDSTTTIDMSKMLFAIYPNNPQNDNIYQMVIVPGADDYFTLSLTNSDEELDSYEVSLLADGLDSTGSNCFIENLNAMDTGYTIVTNPDYGDENLIKDKPNVRQVFSFGDSGLDLSASKETTCKINALYALEDQEVYDIEYLTTFGETNAQFIKNYELVGKNNDWFTPVDIPYNKTNSNSIIAYFLNVNNDSNVYALGPFDKNTGLLGWQFYLAPSTLYYTRVMANTSANSKWAPVFEQTNGILDYTNPVYMLGKEERTKLLNAKCPINFVVYNQRLSVYYPNDNRTHQYKNNIVSEEQNRRCVNEIKKNCKRLLQKYKGELNTVTTRANVVSTLQYYFNYSVMTQNYAPLEYEIVCDDTNNTTEIINANKLAVTVRVRLSPSIKFIDVLVDVFPLGIEFTE